jgi:CNT family concentrative nucleoside transporter
MTQRKRKLRLLVPLWLTAALLLGLGVYSGRAQPAQDTANPITQAAEIGAEARSGVLQPADKEDLPSQSMSAAQRARLAQEEAQGGSLVERLISVLGMVVFLAIGWIFSTNRRAVSWKLVGWGTALQFIFAILILKTAPGRWVFEWLNDAFTHLLGYTGEGARFLFGNLVLNNVPVGTAAGPMDTLGAPTMWANTGAFFAFNVLPTIIFFSSLMTLLYYLGIMQFFVRFFAWVMYRTMGTSGAESLSAAGNIFLGQTEAPLLVKPFVKTMTKSELHCIMTGGFATVAGGVMAGYVGMLAAFFPNIAGHLIAASVMSAPAALVFAKVMYPETEEPETRGRMDIEIPKVDANVIDAAARGAGEGLGLALNVAAMLLAFIALLALLNGIVGGIGGWIGMPDLSIQMILGWVGAPFAWLMGTPWKDALEVGRLIGEKTALNEFVAYLHLAEALQGGSNLSARAVVISTYALCGFANFSSIAIQIGGIGGLAPERRGDLSRLGLRAMVAGTFASFMTACVVGVLL